MSKSYYVYIMANRHRTLYVGVTNDLERRVFEHKNGMTPGFTKRYNINRLVLYEIMSDVSDAISREKQLKGWVRRRKIELIEEPNPDWSDLAADWYSNS